MGSSEPFLPYGRQCLGEEEIEAVAEVLRGDWITQGPTIERFEEQLCRLTGAPYAIAVSSGTAALHLSCLALGGGSSARMITTPLTFAATANAVLYSGSRPVFADIDDGSWTIDAETVVRAAHDARKDGAEIQGLLPVHFAGLPAPLGPLRELAGEQGWFVIEDACHALGAEWRDGSGRWRPIGAPGSEAVVFSFHPVKQITTGEGGAVLTADAGLADRIRSLRHHGIVRDPEKLGPTPGAWYHEMRALGFNYRITDLQCAIGCVQLERLPKFLEQRRRLARRYRDRLAGERRVLLQAQPADRRSAWHLLAVRVNRRDRVFELLRRKRIGAQVHYIPVHLHPYYRDLGYRTGLCPVAEAHAARTLSLPLFPGMTDGDVDRVVHALGAALDEAGAGEIRK